MGLETITARFCPWVNSLPNLSARYLLEGGEKMRRRKKKKKKKGEKKMTSHLQTLRNQEEDARSFSVGLRPLRLKDCLGRGAHDGHLDFHILLLGM